MLQECLAQAVTLESQMEMAQCAVRAKSDFLSKMSHELRTPLNGILGMLHIAQNTQDAAKAADCMRKIESSAKHLLRIINDILDFSHMESGAFTLANTWFSLSGEIDLLVATLKGALEEKRLDLRVTREGIRNDCIYTDRLRFSQVMTTLLTNAVKFTGAGGRIRLVVEEVHHCEGESAYRVTVRDTGVGMGREQAKKLFTPFAQGDDSTTRAHGGTGLGLAIAQRLVRMMGGDIELDTTPGEGSVFQFTIRVPAKEAMDRDPEAPPAL